MIPLLIIGGLVGLVLFSDRNAAVKPSEGGAFVERRGGVAFVKVELVALLMSELAKKYVAPSPLGTGYAEGTALAQIRDDGGQNAAAWANAMQSEGYDVAISINAGDNAVGQLACFPPSARAQWCGPTGSFAVLLLAAPKADPRPS